MRLFRKQEPWINELQGLWSEVEDHMSKAPSAEMVASSFERQHEDMMILSANIVELASVIAKFLDLEKQYQEAEKKAADQEKETEADRLF